MKVERVVSCYSAFSCSGKLRSPASVGLQLLPIVEECDIFTVEL